MATYIVTSQFDDDGGGLTLREAIALTLANGTQADTITFDASLAGETIRLLSSGALVITAGSGVVTINGDINGDGDADVIVSGDSNNNGIDSSDIGIMLAVQSGATLNLVSMALADGYSYSIGSGSVAGIANAGTLSLTDTSIRNMYAIGYSSILSHGGYAIAGILNTGNLTVTDSIFEGNQAIGGNGGSGSGDISGYGFDGYDGGFATAGVFNGVTAQLTIQNSGFVANSATQGSGGVGAYGFEKGGNGGDTGVATTGILNFGTVTGQAAERGGTLTSGAAGGGGGSANLPGDPGTVSATGALIINQGTATGFTDLTSIVLIGDVSGNTTSGNDVISSFNSILGLTGNDTLTGYGGSQTLRGGSGNDIINGGYNTDTIFGGSGNDTVIVSSISYFDNVHGGSGVDTLDHSTSTSVGAADILDFNAGSMKFYSSGQFGVYGALAVSGIETFFDNNNSNNITVSSTGMTVNGNGGDDSITGGLGVDSLDGGSNGTGGDTLRYALSNAGVTVNLDQNTASGGHAEGDSIFGFENVVGSNLGDTLTESAGRNSLFGGQGADTLVIVGGFADEANEVFDGGSGTDTLRFDTVLTDNFVHDLSNDTLTSIEALTFDDPGESYSRAVTLAANQIGGGNIASNAVFNFDPYSDSTETINIGLGGLTSLTLSGLSFTGNTSSASFNITGSSNADTIIGSSIRDIIAGGNGNDIIRGGLGADILNGEGNDAAGDTVEYTGSTVGVNVSLFTGTGSGGHAAGDTFLSIENITGSSKSDVIAGDINANVLKGELGTGDMITFVNSNAAVNVNLTTNVVSGGHAEGDTISGFERVIGSAFDDSLAGTVFANQIAGGNGNDTIFGDAGADSLTGGNGFDTLDHSLSAGGVTINLALNTSSGGNAAGDAIGGFERVNGSNGGVDVLTGTAGVNILRGNGGNDFIEGGAGADILEGGLGSADTVLYTASNAAVTVNLLANTASGGHAQGDVISGFERVTGSAFGDTLIGNNSSNVLSGGLGNDTLTSGSGADSFVFNTALGATNIDSITDFLVVSDTIHLDDAIFTTAGALGALNATLFGFAATADASDRIIYDQATGALFYDTNGSVAGQRTQFATLTTGLAMTAADFLVV